MTLYRPKLGVGTKTLIALSLVFWIPTGALAALLFFMFQQTLQEQLVTQTDLHLRGAIGALQQREQAMQGLLTELAARPDVRRHFENRDGQPLQQALLKLGARHNFYSVLAAVDENQRVLSRRNGQQDDVMVVGNLITSALQSGQAQQSLELVSRDFLVREQGELSNLIKDVGLMQFTVVPVRNDDHTLGVLVGGNLLSADPWLGNTLYNRFGAELALFAGNPREPHYLHATTSLPRTLWSLGQVLPTPVREQVELGKPFSGLLQMADLRITAAFQPLHDSNDRVIGAIGVSVPAAQTGSVVLASIGKAVGFTAIIGLAIALLSVYFVHNDITKPLALLTKAMRRFGRGELTTRVNLKTGDQLEVLGDGFNAMADGICEREERFKKHNEVSKLFMSTMDMDELLDKTLRIVVSVTESQMGIIYLWEEDGACLMPHATYGIASEPECLALGQGFPGRAAKDGERLVITPSKDEAGVSIDMGFMRAIPAEVVYIPLVYQEKVLGVLVLGSTTPYVDDEVNFFDYLADQISIALDNARMHQRIQELSITDGLTGLYNRRFLNSRLEQEWARANRQKLPLSILLSDIDNFKSVNDNYGHDKGDEVIKTVSAVFRDSSRKEDLVARYGGEEFVVVMVNADREAARQMAQRICDAAREKEYPWMDRGATLSIGVATLPDIEADSYEALIEAADKAMYRAKMSGKDRVAIAGDEE
ncbi:MAG: diguanylate cyclase [Pseudomonadota bacterium]